MARPSGDGFKSELLREVVRPSLESTSKVTAAPPRLVFWLKKWWMLASKLRSSHLVPCLSVSSFSVLLSRLR